jgi:hypothetical protein
MSKQGESAPSTFKDLIRGDVRLARKIFRNPRKRRLIKQLQKDGWPIFDLAGKRCAFPADLEATMRAVVAGVAKAGKQRQRRRSERATIASSTSTS